MVHEILVEGLSVEGEVEHVVKHKLNSRLFFAVFASTDRENTLVV